ncbi:hypothetical protein Rrhod_2949 [Rhodococcus rhodnii LMG 5362]|uniref:Uncharacterized protein n=1 Tax=Rhodococcus rhodnii LMG 5362 TaxID=1273125 RepID=R7WNW0_9NOCA|nr:hypothetical protein Rrhod_2949 [Rhodococcus rhodnii LMG 5362]
MRFWWTSKIHRTFGPSRRGGRLLEPLLETPASRRPRGVGDVTTIALVAAATGLV